MKSYHNNNYQNQDNNNDEVKVNKIYNIDCKLLIQKMIKSDFQVDAIITDPPYNISRKNNFETIGRKGIDFGQWDWDFDQLEWLKDIDKILKPGGTIIIFNDWKNLGLISKQLENNGFEIKDLLRWIKPNPMPRNTNRRYVTDYEFAIWATKKGERKWTFNKSKDVPYLKPEFIHSVVSSKKRIHPTEKSESLIEQIIKIHTNEGDIVFDPFSGSGTISYISNKLNRYWIGAEISKKYAKDSRKRIKDSYLKPTFNHLGNKYRIIEDLMRKFPKVNIDYFVEVFAGSGIVSLNYQAPTKIFLNDNDEWLALILEYLINNEANKVIKKTEQIIKKFKLPIDKQNAKYQEQYNKLKDSFNKNKKIDELLVLVLFGFNQQIRFNSNGEFNIPVGKFSWNSYQRNKLLNYCLASKNKRISIKNLDFEDFIKITKSEVDKEKTIFYFDPPYLITNATYNSQWNEKKEKKLISILKQLTKEGYKWFLSNVLSSKGKTNNYLLKFIESNKNIKYEFLNDITYKNSNYQRKNSSNDEDKEILVWGNINA